MELPIPLIDLETDPSENATQLRRACMDIGFFFGKMRLRERGALCEIGIIILRQLMPLGARTAVECPVRHA